MTDHIATLEECAKSMRNLATIVRKHGTCAPGAIDHVADKMDAAIALMRGQSWKRELIDDIRRRLESGEAPKMTEARAEYWKAGARWAIGIVNVAIHELHNVPKDPADEQ